jgi:hypothetical protein
MRKHKTENLYISLYASLLYIERVVLYSKGLTREVVPVQGIKEYVGNGVITPLFLNLDTRRRPEVNFMTRPFILGERTRHTFNKRLDGPQNPSRRFWRKSSAFTGI